MNFVWLILWWFAYGHPALAADLHNLWTVSLLVCVFLDPAGTARTL